MSQDRIHAELFSRRDDGVWALREAGGLAGAVRLTSLDVLLAPAERYRNLDLAPAGGVRVAPC